jgi:hypothetical protein
VKRSLICAGIIVALAIPAPTSAGVPDFEGRDRDGGTVSFETKVRHGRIKKVATGFAWKNLYVRCHEGWSKTDGSFTRPMRVRHRRFHGTGRTHTAGGEVIARVTGRFSRRENKAHGRIRVHGNFNAGATNCDTGKDRWKAHRVAA